MHFNNVKAIYEFAFHQYISKWVYWKKHSLTYVSNQNRMDFKLQISSSHNEALINKMHTKMYWKGYFQS